MNFNEVCMALSNLGYHVRVQVSTGVRVGVARKKTGSVVVVDVYERSNDMWLASPVNQFLPYDQGVALLRAMSVAE